MIRTVAQSLKPWLFAGSLRDGKRLAEPRQPGGCKLKTGPVRPVVAARPADYVCSEDPFY
ncbi:hypothetical protein APX81_18065 [Escherichia coli]|nr:hypothetical protein APU33_03165 [Escherichia coli]PAZ31170.1 hypothetical protein APU34_08635 [Escherichia coli]PAZ33208.1 hypothetical protein APU35_25210 [Escherichia coli]PAZ33531.1 hypothetical protein APU36_28590 [Escherichia coli]PAZ44868.1 hypothetical protein APX81_18065 [Escherichia coli]